MADDFARQLLDALYNPETQPPQQPSRPLREKLAGAAETAATIGTGLLGSVPAGLAGLTQLIPTRGHRPSVNRAAQKVEDVQSALTYLPRTEAGQEYLEKTAGALGVLGMPAEFLGEQTLKLTGSPFLATAANVGLDPVNYIGIPGTGKAAAAATKATGRAIAATPRVAGEMISDLVMPAPRAQAQRGAIDLGPQIPEFQPQTALGLVSRADEALAALPRNKGTGAEFLRELEKTPGVRMAELEDRGLVEALSNMGKVTKADVIKALQDNPPVQLKEVMLGSESLTHRQKLAIEYDRAREESARVGGSTNPSYIERIPESNRTPEEQRLLEAWNRVDQSLEESWLSENPPPKYGQYTLPGGENYREILLTLPVKKAVEQEVRLEPRMANFGGRRDGFNAYIGDAFIGWGRTEDEARAYAIQNAPDDTLQNYRSGHWKEPNVLAHARISDRTGANGEKILHVEEVQSDWHQTGRKSGYKTGKEQQQLDEAKWQYSFNKGMQQDFYRFAEGLPEGDPQRLKYLQQANDLTPKLMKLDSEISRIRQAMEEGVPDAPFKKNWHELMMRRLVDYAAKNGYDRIAITPGAEQASRYDLSKQVDEINVVGRVNALTGEKTKSVALDMKSGESLRLGVSADGTVDNVNNDSIKNFVGKKLSDVIGKDLSNKILSEDVKTLSGVDLQVGGEGMKGFYDKILPTYLNELGKPYGVKVGQMEIEIPGKEKRVLERIPGEIWSKSIQKPETFSAHSFDITPQMREAIKSKGLPLYAKGGSVHISYNPDTMRLELAAGGAVAAAKAAAKAAEKAAAKAKPVYPQAEALERARQNAVKMLNLPENNTPEMRAQAMGYIDYLHGTQRLDRLLEGKTLDPRRATSGPMPYGTTTPELASSYATSKADTSRRATDEGDVRRYFEVAPKDIGIQGLRSPLPVETAWHFMTPEQQAKIRELAPRVGYENLDEFTGNLIVHPEGVNGNLSANHWNWLMKNEAKGNPLTALRHMWYESGQLVDEPETLGQIYRLAGVNAPISQTKAPWTEAQGVLLGKARITNPIDTSNTEQVAALIEPLKQAFARDRSRTKAGGPDQWAKDSRYTPRSWVSELEKDLAEGKESYVWTSIPDKVTAELRRLGFNGIIDRSGKGGGAKEPVVIPFDPAQVRSRFAAFDPAEMDKPDLLKKTGGEVHVSDNPDTMQLELAKGGGVGEKRDLASKIAGGGIRGIITRGLLGMDPPEDMTPREREIYENMARMSAPAQGLGVGKAIFIGANAKTWNKAAAARAVELEKAGVTPEQIWRETGTFRGADGKLRQEISDVGAVHRNPKELQELGKAKKEEAKELQSRIAGIPGQKDLFPKALTEAKRPVREQIKQLKEEADQLMRPSDTRGQSARFALEHPELYKAYPELGDIPVYQGVYGSGRELGSLRGVAGDLEMSVTQSGLRKGPRSTMLHEMQHAVQSLEGMSPGGSSTMAFQDPKAFEILKQLREEVRKPPSFEEFQRLNKYPESEAQNAYAQFLKEREANPILHPAIERSLQERAANEYYKRLAGEVEARATQYREGMGPTQRRQEFPYSSYDVLPDDLIVKPPRSGLPITAEAVKPTAEQAAIMAAQRAEMALRSRAMQELKDQFENLPQPPKGFLSPENILQRMDEIRRREATPSGEQIPLLKKGGKVKFTDNLDTMRLAVQKRK